MKGAECQRLRSKKPFAIVHFRFVIFHSAPWICEQVENGKSTITNDKWFSVLLRHFLHRTGKKIVERLDQFVV
jgi:hypothetical protein